MLFFLFNASIAFAQLSVRTEKNFTKMVNQVLVGGGVTVSNVIFRGDTGAIGIFDGRNSNIGLDSGILISTGKAFNAIGPNNGQSSTSNNKPGDGDLNSILPNGNTIDAASLQFNFIPVSSTVTFRFVFASEEYPEFVGEEFNDIFGFFISGPGIAGKKNIAVIPGTSTTISINNINPAVNSNFYISNDGGGTVQFDGFTTVIEVKAEGLTPCELYTLKLAIADVEDIAYDSGIFIEALSLRSEKENEAKVSVLYPIGNPPGVYEKCDSIVFQFSRSSNNTTNPLTVTYDTAGTATMGVDYPNLPGSITIPAGQLSAFLTVFPNDDNVVEPTEDLILEITSNGICSKSSALCEISDFDTLKITGITKLDCTGDTLLMLVKTAGGSTRRRHLWTDSLGAVLSITPILIVSPDSLTMYIINIFDSCTNTTVIDTFFLGPITPIILTLPNDTVVCPFSNLSLLVTANFPNNFGLIWSAVDAQKNPVGLFNNDTIPNPVYTVPDGVYEITITVEATDDSICALPVSMIVRTVRKGIQGRKPLYVCENGTATLAAFGGVKYRWTPTTGLSNDTIPNPVASAEGNYTVQITDSINCIQSFSVAVNFDTIPIANAGRDAIICERESVQLQARGSDYNKYEWSPAASLDNFKSAAPLASPSVTTTYYLRAINNACSSIDSVTVFVVPIPEVDFDHSFDSCARVLALSNKTIGSDSLVWYFGDGDTSLVKNPVHKYDSAGTYEVMLIANKGTNCSDTSSISITINDAAADDPFIPTVFTPNGDGRNDTFKITGGNFACRVESISIYNRWGKLLVELKDTKDWYWDGKVNGQVSAPGIYFYAIKGEGIEKVGTVQIIL